MTFTPAIRSATRSRILAVALASVIAVSPAGAASAQTVIMRKPLEGAVFGGAGGYQPPQHAPSGTPTPSPTPTPAQTGEWTTSQARPLAPSCSATAPGVRDVWCAAPGGDRLPDSACAGKGDKPDTSATVSDFSGCGYAWQPVGTTEWSSTCSDHATATRRYVCQRQDGASVPASNCDASHQETETETAANLTNCSYEVSQWQAYSYSSTCSATARITFRATGCIRFGGGDAPAPVPVSQCQAAGVPVEKTDTAPVYDGCTYQATYSTTYGTCTSGQQSAPIVSCRRSDGVDVTDLSLCGSQQTTRSCTVAACGTVKRYYYFNGGSPGTTLRVTTADAATSYCNSIVRAGQKGVCVWNNSGGAGGPAYFAEGATLDTTGNGGLWASTCG